jgi:hypothetical protein
VLTGWWFLRNYRLYGDFTGNKVVQAMWCCDPIPPARALYLFVTGLLGRFGQGLMITYPRPVYLVAAALVLIALAGLVRRARSAATGPRPWPTPFAALWAIHAATVVTVTGALVFYAMTVTPGLPGRYMFAAFPSMALLLAAGWLAWPWGGPRGRALGALALGGLNIAAALYAVFGMVLPTYAMPRTPTPSELRAMTPVDAQIEETARVLGYRLSAVSAHAGDTVTVTVYWQPLSRTDVPYTVFLHLLPPGAPPVAQRDTFPALGNYATTIWDVGRPFVDTYTLPLPPEAAGAGECQLVFGLYNGETGARLPVTGRDAGSPEEAWVRLGTLPVLP